jgi:predicted DNA binding protein
MTMKERFSKRTLGDRLELSLTVAEQQHHFVSTNGYAQVLPKNITDRERALIMRAYYYGRYDAELDLWQSLQE